MSSSDDILTILVALMTEEKLPSGQIIMEADGFPLSGGETRFVDLVRI